MRRIIVVALTLTALGPSMLGAQRDGGKRVERPVPFKIGETLTYDVSWSSFITAGTAAATIKEKKASFNSTAYYIVAEGRPTPIVAKLYSFYYKLDTLLDSYTLLPQRGSVYSEEGSRHRFKVTRFDHAAHKALFDIPDDRHLRDKLRGASIHAGPAVGHLRPARRPVQGR